MNRCRIHPATEPPPAEVLDQVRKLPSTIVSDQLERSGFVSGVRQLTENRLGIMAGPALTVRTRPGDNLVIYKAIELASEGDILVVDAGGATDRAVMGEIVCRHAAAKGIGGLVIDGVIRDVAEISAGDLPVFARGASHLGPFKNGPGEIRGVVSVGGTVVRNGDLVVGDADGVAVLPVERVEEAIKGGLAALAREDGALAQAAAGELDTSWIDDSLEIEWVGEGPVERPEHDQTSYPLRPNAS